MNAIVYIKMQPQLAAYLRSRFGCVNPGEPLRIPKNTAIPWDYESPSMPMWQKKVMQTLDRILYRGACVNNNCAQSTYLYEYAFCKNAYERAVLSPNEEPTGHVPPASMLPQLVPVMVPCSDVLKPQANYITLKRESGQRFSKAATLLFKNALSEYLTGERREAELRGEDFDIKKAVIKFCEMHRFPEECIYNLNYYCSYRWKFC